MTREGYREIEFRGLRPRTENWVYGDIELYDEEFAAKVNGYSVKYESIGQYTGIKDNLERKIFEGDILIDRNEEKLTVTYDNMKFKFINTQGKNRTNSLNFDNIVVIGNIHTGSDLKDYIGKTFIGEHQTMRVHDVGYSGKIYGIVTTHAKDGDGEDHADEINMSPIDFLRAIHTMEEQLK